MLKRYIFAVFAFFGILASSSAWAQFEQCRDQFPGALPVLSDAAPGHLRAICFSGFAVLHSGDTKTPLYSVTRLNASTVAQHFPRTDKFYEEARLPASERAQLTDYAHSGFDRGHMTEAAAGYTEEMEAQTFSLANMIPQDPQLNREAWAKLEASTRKYIKRASGNVYVFTGPDFSENLGSIGPDHVRVPAHVFKLVYDQAAGRAWAFYMKNVGADRPEPPISYAELVKRTGIEFLPGIKLR